MHNSDLYKFHTFKIVKMATVWMQVSTQTFPVLYCSNQLCIKLAFLTVQRKAYRAGAICHIYWDWLVNNEYCSIVRFWLIYCCIEVIICLPYHLWSCHWVDWVELCIWHPELELCNHQHPENINTYLTSTKTTSQFYGLHIFTSFIIMIMWPPFILMFCIIMLWPEDVLVIQYNCSTVAYIILILNSYHFIYLNKSLLTKWFNIIILPQLHL